MEPPEKHQGGGNVTPPPVQGVPMPQKGPILTLQYNGGAPPPHPPCTDPTPEEEWQLHESNRVEDQQTREVSRQQNIAKQEQTDAGKGAWFGMKKLASAAVSVVQTTAENLHAKSEKSVRSYLQKQDQDRFAINFPELIAAGDNLICDYKCRVLHRGQEIRGHLHVCARHLCFSSEELKDIIPLNEVASLQKSCALETIDNGPPFVMPIPAPHILYNCLQVFTVKYQVFQFLHFENTTAAATQHLTNTLKGRPIDRFYNFLDHTWRHVTQVPLPSFQYAPY